MNILPFYIRESSTTRLLTVLFFTVASGITNALFILSINRLLNELPASRAHFLWCVGWFGLYLWFGKVAARQMNMLNNELFYDLSRKVLKKLIRSEYTDFEKIRREEIIGSLVHDATSISHSSNLLIYSLSAVLTIVICLAYLATISGLGFLWITTGVLAGICAPVYLNRNSPEVWKQIREKSQVYSGHLNDLIAGFKELSMNGNKMQDFFDNALLSSLAENRKLKTIGNDHYIKVQTTGSFIIFSALIGFVSFAKLQGLGQGLVVSSTIVFLYITSPLLMIIRAFSTFKQTSVAIHKLEEFIRKISGKEATGPVPARQGPRLEEWSRLVLKDVKYTHQDSSRRMFHIGPVNLELNRGEIVFLTGGNGSGKTTLIKLLLGLYKPQGGKVCFQGNGPDVCSAADSDEFRRHFSPVFFDFHLFRKLYGIELQGKDLLLNQYLRELHLHNKVTVTGGQFDTTDLSHGQRKRLSLLAALLEERSFFVFDEFASEQDPEFKHYIYTTIFPNLKRQGKTVLVITHDMQYFHRCDHLYKMEYGRISKLNAREVPMLEG